jgi:dihydroxyacetone kinase-like protein
MKKFLNEPDDFVAEMIEGLLLSYPDHLRAVPGDGRVVARATRSPAGRQQQVGIVTGGGAGHLPLFLGYIGDGLLTSAAVGNVFSAQSSDAALTAIRAASAGHGVLVLIGNYTGDRLNFELARDLAHEEGIKTELVLGADDVLSAAHAEDRRGVAGIVFAYKCAGASAARGDDLAAVAGIARRVVERTASAGVGLSPTVLPTTGRPSFEIGENEMEIGIGIHGETGVRRVELARADDIAEELLDTCAEALDLQAGARVALLVNGLGATSQEELFVLSRHLHHSLAKRDVRVHRTLVGEFATSMEMAGASVSLLLLDEELTELLDAPASSPFVPGCLI